jgi:hypothetical protein
MSVINVLAVIPVNDFDAHAAEVASRGVDLGEITDGGTVRFIVAADPSGNAITFAQAVVS